jgi:hypothetical protein
VTDERKEGQPFKRGDEVWIRGKVMNALNDEIVVAPYAHRNGGGSVAVKREDVLLAAPQPSPRGSEALRISQLEQQLARTEALFDAANNTVIELGVKLAAATAERTPPKWECTCKGRNNKPAIWHADADCPIHGDRQPASPRYWNYECLPCIKCGDIHDGGCQPAPPDGRRAPQCPKCGSYKLRCHNNGCTWEIPSGAS